MIAGKGSLISKLGGISRLGSALAIVAMAGIAGLAPVSARAGGAMVSQYGPYASSRGIFSWAPLLKKVNPAVVRVELGYGAGNGSGVIVDARNGYVVTSRHVISGVRRIRVVMSNGRAYRARVIATDRRTDVAVLKVPSSACRGQLGFTLASRPSEGDIVLAIGYPFGLQRSVIMGVVSNTGRPVGRYYSERKNSIQIDALANPGNSGGPAINSRGQLIGIVSSIYGRTSQGISFLTPASVVRKTVLALLARKGLSLSYSPQESLERPMASAAPAGNSRQQMTAMAQNDNNASRAGRAGFAAPA